RTSWLPARTARGRKVISREPSSAPSTSPPQRRAAAWTAARCCAPSPGLRRRARMLRIRTAWPVHIASDSDVRRICPPPSPRLPSTDSTGAPLQGVELELGVEHVRLDGGVLELDGVEEPAAVGAPV